MSTRLVLDLFKGASEAEFRTLIQQAAANIGAELRWGVPGTSNDNLFRFHSEGPVHCLALPDRSHRFSLELARLSQLPWLALRIQESSLWDYTLHRGTEVLDNFSPWPEHWEDPEEPGFAAFKQECLGRPGLLASVWDVPIENIERYIRQWVVVADPDAPAGAPRELTGKAYPTDRYPYGSDEQFFDVLKALGVREPFADNETHTLNLPARRVN